MCLIIFSWKNHPNYPLILVANRDEFYNRKTEKANFWKEYPNILAGKDLEAGGTWMGISRTGRLAMLTNYRDLSNLKSNAPSRGKLVLDYLNSEWEAREFLSPLEKTGSVYNGYNILAGNQDELYYQSNYSKNGIEKLDPGIHGLSNALLNTSWPKVNTGKEKLEKLISSNKINTDQLFDLMRDDHRFPKKDLPDTGIGMEKEHILSSMFIKSPNYGSRCSTVLLIDNSGNVLFSERTYNTTDFTFSESSFEFKIS